MTSSAAYVEGVVRGLRVRRYRARRARLAEGNAATARTKGLAAAASADLAAFGDPRARATCARDVRDALAHASDTLAARLDALAIDHHCDIAVLAARCGLGLADAATCRRPLPPPPPSDLARLAGVIDGWRAHAGADAWRRAAAEVVAALPRRGIEAVAVAALANALVDDCDPDVVAAVATDARALRRRPDHDPRYDPHLAILAKATPSACAATHARHRMP